MTYERRAKLLAPKVILVEQLFIKIVEGDDDGVSDNDDNEGNGQDNAPQPSVLEACYLRLEASIPK